MGWVDQIPRAGKLFIGGLHALHQRPDLFERHGITHIVSVLDFDISSAGAFKQYDKLMLQVDDDCNEILLKHFTLTNEYIEQALTSGGGVFVHCAMGKSRSATVVCAYLMKRFRLSPQQALNQVCEGRPVCSPNPGFMEQLEIYHEMLSADSDRSAADIYEAWESTRFVGDWWSWHARERRQSKLS